LVFRQQLEEESFELLVGAIDLVDQQDGRTRALRINRLEERALDEKRVAVEIAVRALARQRVGRVEAATAPASAVLPTPASPSRNSGRLRRSARNNGTARPRSAT